MQVRFFTGEQVEQIRPVLEPILTAMLTRTPCRDFEAADVFALAEAKRCVLGLVEDESGPVLGGAFEFRHYPQETAVNVMALGGKRMDEALDAFWPTFRAWAKQAGATRIEASCAEPMARLLSRAGFARANVNMMQVL